MSPSNSVERRLLDAGSERALIAFFNAHHDKLLCTSNAFGEPNISIMGTPRLSPDGSIEFEVSDPGSRTLDNIRENGAIVIMVYVPGARARDYVGARIYARVSEIADSGEKFDLIRRSIEERHGQEKAEELQATVTCQVTRVRPVVDRGQRWDQLPFE